MHLEGIHHITAITGDARRNLDFYVRVLHTLTPLENPRPRLMAR